MWRALVADTVRRSQVQLRMCILCMSDQIHNVCLLLVLCTCVAPGDYYIHPGGFEGWLQAQPGAPEKVHLRAGHHQH